MLLHEHIQELPEDIQETIYNQTMELREPRTVLEPIQKLDICTYAKFHDIIDLIMMKHYHEKRTSLNWFENMLLYELNDSRSLFEEFSSSMYRAFDGLNVDEIISAIDTDHFSEQAQIRSLRHYWKHLSPGRRNRLYRRYINEISIEM